MDTELFFLTLKNKFYDLKINNIIKSKIKNETIKVKSLNSNNRIKMKTNIGNNIIIHFSFNNLFDIFDKLKYDDYHLDIKITLIENNNNLSEYIKYFNQKYKTNVNDKDFKTICYLFAIIQIYNIHFNIDLGNLNIKSSLNNSNYLNNKLLSSDTPNSFNCEIIYKLNLKKVREKIEIKKLTGEKFFLNELNISLKREYDNFLKNGNMNVNLGKNIKLIDDMTLNWNKNIYIKYEYSNWNDAKNNSHFLKDFSFNVKIKEIFIDNIVIDKNNLKIISEIYEKEFNKKVPNGLDISGETILKILILYKLVNSYWFKTPQLDIEKIFQKSHIDYVFGFEGSPKYFRESDLGYLNLRTNKKIDYIDEDDENDENFNDNLDEFLDDIGEKIEFN